MHYYPIVLIPKAFKDATRSFPQIGPKPSKPQKPDEKENLNIGCIGAFFVILLILWAVNYDNEDIQILFQAIGLIVLVVLFRENSKKAKTNKENHEKYLQHVAEYEYLLKKWETKRQSIENNKELLARHRSGELEKVIKGTIPADVQFISQKGYSEAFFETYLKKYFGSKILKNLSIKDRSFKRPYQPDFIYKCPTSNLHIDIEIDEPYVLNEGTPIHFQEYGISIDHDRNNYFLERGWVVVRFAEQQVIKFPEECCYIIKGVIKTLLDKKKSDIQPHLLDSIPRISQWTKEDAEKLCKDNFRLGLIAEKKIELDARSINTYVKKQYNEGKAHFDRQNYSAATTCFTEVLRYQKNHQKSLYYRAISLRYLNKIDDSIIDLNSILEGNSKSSKVFNQLGICFSCLKKYSTALENYTKAISISSEDIYFKNRAIAYKKIGEFNRAISDYSEYIKSNPKSSISIYHRGLLHKRNGDIELALRDFSTAIAIQPNKKDYLNKRGVCHLYLGKPERASIDFNKVIDIDKSDSTANHYLDFIESVFFGNHLNLISINYKGRDLTTFTNTQNLFNMAFFDFLKNEPNQQKWNQLSEYWKNHFRTEVGFRGTPDDDILSEIFLTRTLELNMKGLQDISVVKMLPELEELSIGWNPVNDISDIQSCTNLKLLIVSGTRIEDLSPCNSPLNTLTKV